jgi:hypothetical protein
VQYRAEEDCRTGRGEVEADNMPLRLQAREEAEHQRNQDNNTRQVEDHNSALRGPFQARDTPEGEIHSGRL